MFLERSGNHSRTRPKASVHLPGIDADSRPARPGQRTLRDEIPEFELPLKAGDCSPLIDLKPILDGIYDRGGYPFRIDYSPPSIPPLSKENAALDAT